MLKTIGLDAEQVTPSKIVCVGRNYAEHIRELGNETPDEMVVFNKPNSAISETLYANRQEALHYEGEICFLIDHQKLAGVGFGLDLTQRELQSKLKSKGLPWERAKAFDGAACFSDFVGLSGTQIGSLTMELEVNSERRQSGGYELMIYKPEQILAEILEFMSLEDGDIIMTGTPSGVGRVLPGDRFRGSIYAGGELIVSREWTAV